VKPRLTGTLPAGLHIRKVNAVPDEVMMEGPDSVMTRIESVRTEEIRLPAIGSSRTVTSKLEVPAHIRSISADSVSVRILLGK
jgi:YbbR domain-containing protein